MEDPGARETAEELVATLMELYGDGLARILEIVDGLGDAGHDALDAFVSDGTVGSLLLIHGLYPIPLAERVEEALDSVRPYMESHGGDVELVSLDGDVAHLRLKGTCNGCPASAATLELAVKQALEEAAPDLLGIEVEGLAEPPRRRRRLPLADGHGPREGGPRADRAPVWVELQEPPGVLGGGMVPVEVGGERLIVAKVGGRLLAYRDACAGCGGPLHRGELDDGILTCPGCERRFELPLAGQAVSDGRLQLTPVPLLAEAGRMRIAVPA